MLKQLIDYFIIKLSGLFDSNYYLIEYKDCRLADIDPLWHYVRYGWKEGRNPSRNFDTSKYIENNQDVQLAGINPLRHYISYGKNEGREIFAVDLKASYSIKENLSSNSKGSPFEINYKNLLSQSKGERDENYVDITTDQFEQEKIKLISFYLPQYHPIPENNQWWGQGFTEWTNVSKAVPQFVGHYQPHLPGELGFYDLRVSEVIRRQVELATLYGIYGFCFYYYWFDGKRLLEKPLDNFISDPLIDFPFCVCWANENWTRRWDGRENNILIAQNHSYDNDKMIIHDFINLFSNPNYIRINGRPLVIVYRADIMSEVEKTLEYWRRSAINSGNGNPYILVAQTFGYTDPRSDGFDGAVEFPPHNGEQIQEITHELTILNKKYSGQVFRYSDFAEASMRRITARPFKRFNTVFPSWDNDPRRPGDGLTFFGSRPEIYGKWLLKACQFALDEFSPEERIVFINAWNEWGEGAYLEPDRIFGYAYLQETQNVLKKINDNRSTQTNLENIKSNNNESSQIQIHFSNVVNSFPAIQDFINENDLENSIIELALFIDKSLSFEIANKEDDITATILIPVYNHFEDTYNCIKSISQTSEKYKFELIVIDDNSSDFTYDVLSKCKKINYLRNEENLGFLTSVNHGAQFAKGKYLILLNNDTVVMPGWLNHLIDTFTDFSNAGLVGSKLVYPDGRLQEAGGIIWKDASGINYGRDDDPNKPEYNYLREVDYCSGACICIPTLIWNELKGFDTVFTPAYYEDTDLAFRIRLSGYKVLYQPKSQVIHKEGVTSGTDINHGVKHFQALNKEKFFDRWKEILSNHGDISQKDYQYRNRTRKKHVLVIDVCTPKPDQDSGSIDTYQYLLSLRKLGFEVSFISVVDSNIIDNYVEDLQKKGIQCIYQPYLKSINSFMKKFGNLYDLVFLFRAPFGGKFIDIVRKYAPKAKIVFNTVDLHSLRERRERDLAVKDGALITTQENISEEDEFKIIKKSDKTILVSRYEQQLLNDLIPDNNAVVIPIPRKIPGRIKNFNDRSNIVFIGGFLHKPNVDAVLYFINEIWPLVENQLPGVEFLIIGSNIPENIKKLENKNIRIVGFVPDLTEIFSNCKLSVAPLRYGAGIKGKVITSLSYGVPCVASAIATEGTGFTNYETIIIANSPQEYADSIVKIYNDINLWEKISTNGMNFLEENFSIEKFENNLFNLIQDLKINPKN